MKISLLLAAIAIVESDNRDFAVGKAGEMSRYQITRQVWEEHSNLPFDSYSADQKAAELVAKKHIIYCILPEIIDRDKSIDVETIAACWNAGVRGALELGRGEEYAKKVRAEYDRLEGTIHR